MSAFFTAVLQAGPEILHSRAGQFWTLMLSAEDRNPETFGNTFYSELTAYLANRYISLQTVLHFIGFVSDFWNTLHIFPCYHWQPPALTPQTKTVSPPGLFWFIKAATISNIRKV